MTEATQSLLPVTPEEDRCDICCRPREQHVGRDLQCDTTTYFRPMPSQSHPLPGDVGMREATLQADVELVAEAVAQRCSTGSNKDGSPKAPARYATIWQAARLGALEYAKMIGSDTVAVPVAEPWPGCYADLQQRRVTTLAKLGLMLSVMAGGEAPEVVGYDAADLYAEVLMALAIEDAEDTDIALEEARDHPGDDCIAALTPSPCPGDVGTASTSILEASWDIAFATFPESTDAFKAGVLAARIQTQIAAVRDGMTRAEVLTHLDMVEAHDARAALTPSALSGEEQARKIAREVCDRRNLKRDNGLVYGAALEAAKEALGLSALSGDAGEGETLREALAKRTSMSTIAGGGQIPHVEIRFANVADAHALTDAILNRSNKEDDHGPRP